MNENIHSLLLDFLENGEEIINMARIFTPGSMNKIQGVAGMITECGLSRSGNWRNATFSEIPNDDCLRYIDYASGYLHKVTLIAPLGYTDFYPHILRRLKTLNVDISFAYSNLHDLQTALSVIYPRKGHNIHLRLR